MTPEEAAELLGLAGDRNPPDVIDAAYGAKNEELNDKILEAPTPALRKKYMAAKDALTEARRVLEAANGGSAAVADNLPVVDLPTSGGSESLPVLEENKGKDEGASDGKEKAAAPTPGGSGALARVAMFLLVILIAGGGAAGWWFGIEQPKREKAGVLFAEGAGLQQQEQWVEARAKLEESLATWPGHARARTQLDELLAAVAVESEQALKEGKAQEDLRQYRKAMTIYQAAQVIDAENEDLQQAVERLESTIRREVERHLVEGRMAQSSEQWEKSIEAYRKVTELDPENVEASAAVSSLESMLANARGSIKVNTEPGGARVSLAGQDEDLSPATFHQLKLGRHMVWVEKPGFNQVRKEVVVTKDQITPLDVRLTRSEGVLQITSGPEGMSYEVKAVKSEINDSRELEFTTAGSTPGVVADLPTGSYEVVMKRSGWPDYRQVHEVKRDEKVAVDWLFGESTLAITTRPAAKQIRFNGETIKASGMGTRQVPSGSYEIVAVYDEGIEKTMKVNLEPGQQRQVSISRKVHVVPDAYQTIQAAIDASQPGDQVLVKKGAYQESLKFKSGIHLKGEGREETVVEFFSTHDFNPPLLIEDCEGGLVDGLNFRQTQQHDSENPPPAVQILNSNVLVENCAVANLAGAGVSLIGGDVILRACEIVDVRQEGVNAWHGRDLVMPDGTIKDYKEKEITTIDIDSCKIERTGAEGVMVAGIKRFSVINSSIWDIEDNGIYAFASDGRVEGVSVSDTKSTGIFISNKAHVEVEDCKIVRSTAQGISVGGEKANAAVIDCVITGGESAGIMFWGGASGEVIGNTVTKMGKTGIWVWGGFVGKIHNNICSGNKYNGITARGSDTKPSIIGNKCSGNKGNNDIAIETVTHPTAFEGNTGRVNRSAKWSD